VFNFPATTSFANGAAITIPSSGPASPYPSAINVSGLAGLVSKVKVTLNNLTHAFPDDVNMLLVAPAGQKLVLMAHTGGGHGITNVTLTFDDAAASALPSSSLISSGTFKPSNNGFGNSFPFPAPSGPYGPALLSNFNGTDPNGNWSLYVMDSATGDGGAISGGWSLDITTISPFSAIADLAASMTAPAGTVRAGDQFIFNINVSNHGPGTSTGVVVTDGLPAGLSFVSAIASQGTVTSGSGIITCNVGNLSSGANATIAITVSSTIAGTFTNKASVAGNEVDLNLDNNASEANVAIQTLVPPHLVAASTQANGSFQLTLIGQVGDAYVIQASTNLVNWTPVATNIIAGTGAYKFTDTNAPSFRQRYYRAVRVP
jgi:large repetitive protein